MTRRIAILNALLMAGAQWGGTYKASAVTLINAIWDKEVESGSNVLKGSGTMTFENHAMRDIAAALEFEAPTNAVRQELADNFKFLAFEIGTHRLVISGEEKIHHLRDRGAILRLAQVLGRIHPIGSAGGRRGGRVLPIGGRQRRLQGRGRARRIRWSDRGGERSGR
jgi:hypothetical protein